MTLETTATTWVDSGFPAAAEMTPQTEKLQPIESLPDG